MLRPQASVTWRNDLFCIVPARLDYDRYGGHTVGGMVGSAKGRFGLVQCQIRIDCTA